MKKYIHEGKIIREDELKEITLPKVGDRLRFIVDALTNPNQKVGEKVTVEGLHPIEIKDKNGMFGIISLQEYCTCFEPIPSPPVCPPELLPLPDGAVYLGMNCGYYPKWMWMGGSRQWDGQGYNGNCSYHYATVAGDACHRAQPWFDESQVPKVYPPPESEWPEKPAPPEGHEWVRVRDTENARCRKGDMWLSRNGKGWCIAAYPWTIGSTVVFRAEKIDPAEQAWLKYDGTANHKELFKAGFNAARKNEF